MIEAIILAAVMIVLVSLTPVKQDKEPPVLTQKVEIDPTKLRKIRRRRANHSVFEE